MSGEAWRQVELPELMRQCDALSDEIRALSRTDQEERRERFHYIRLD
jgi:hypothetical protein